MVYQRRFIRTTDRNLQAMNSKNSQPRGTLYIVRHHQNIQNPMDL